MHEATSTAIEGGAAATDGEEADREEAGAAAAPRAERVPFAIVNDVAPNSPVSSRSVHASLVANTLAALTLGAVLQSNRSARSSCCFLFARLSLLPPTLFRLY